MTATLVNLTECECNYCATELVRNGVEGPLLKMQGSTYITSCATLRNLFPGQESQEQTCILGLKLYTQHVIKVNSLLWPFLTCEFHVYRLGSV